MRQYLENGRRYDYEYTVWVKKIPPAACGFLAFFTNGWEF